MNAAIPASHADLFDKKAFAHIACHLKDGSILVNPVWCDYDGKYVVFNTAVDRLKDRALRRDPAVTLCLSDPENPYRYLEIRGKVEEITEEGAEAHIDKLAKKYTGADRYGNRTAGEVRVIYRIRPEKVMTFPPK